MLHNIPVFSSIYYPSICPDTDTCIASCNSVSQILPEQISLYVSLYRTHKNFLPPVMQKLNQGIIMYIILILLLSRMSIPVYNSILQLTNVPITLNYQQHCIWYIFLTCAILNVLPYHYINLHLFFWWLMGWASHKFGGPFTLLLYIAHSIDLKNKDASKVFWMIWKASISLH
jgi:hypothetical protein